MIHRWNKCIKPSEVTTLKAWVIRCASDCTMDLPLRRNEQCCVTEQSTESSHAVLTTVMLYNKHIFFKQITYINCTDTKSCYNMGVLKGWSCRLNGGMQQVGVLGPTSSAITQWLRSKNWAANAFSCILGTSDSTSWHFRCGIFLINTIWEHFSKLEQVPLHSCQ